MRVDFVVQYKQPRNLNVLMWGGGQVQLIQDIKSIHFLFPCGCSEETFSVNRPLQFFSQLARLQLDGTLSLSKMQSLVLHLLLLDVYYYAATLQKCNGCKMHFQIRRRLQNFLHYYLVQEQSHVLHFELISMQMVKRFRLHLICSLWESRAVSVVDLLSVILCLEDLVGGRISSTKLTSLW